MPLSRKGSYRRLRSPIPVTRCLDDLFRSCRRELSADEIISFTVSPMVDGELCTSHRPIFGHPAGEDAPGADFRTPWVSVRTLVPLARHLELRFATAATAEVIRDARSSKSDPTACVALPRSSLNLDGYGGSSALAGLRDPGPIQVARQWAQMLRRAQPPRSPPTKEGNDADHDDRR